MGKLAIQISEEGFIKNAEEEKQRLWNMKGLADFAEILRSSDSNFETFCAKIIKNLIQYVNANQGSIYIVQELNDEKFLEL